MLATMRKKRMLLGVAAASALAALTGMLFNCFPPKPLLPIGRDHYRKVQLGMTAAEACDSVGVAPGDFSGAFHYGTSQSNSWAYTGLEVSTFDIRGDGTVAGLTDKTQQPVEGFWWRGREGMLVVFVCDDSVIQTIYYDGHPMTFWDYCRDRWGRR